MTPPDDDQNLNVAMLLMTAVYVMVMLTLIAAGSIALFEYFQNIP